MGFLLEFPAFLVTMHVAIVLAIGVRVVMRRSARGIALSSLLLVATLPYGGALLFLLIGERRIGRKRSHGITVLRTDFRQIAKATIPADFTAIDWPSLPVAAQGMDRLGRSRVEGGATANIQVVPWGPGETGDGLRELSLENVYIGDPVEIVLDLYQGRIIVGRVSGGSNP